MADGTLHIPRLRQFLGVIGDAIAKLRQLGSLSEEAFLADFRNTESAKYLLVKATEAAIDICNHIVAKAGGRAPQDYADCFGILQELGVISAHLATRLKKMARFRNLVIHLYWEVDDAKVYKIIQGELSDLEEFRQSVADFIARRPA